MVSIRRRPFGLFRTAVMCVVGLVIAGCSGSTQGTATQTTLTLVTDAANRIQPAIDLFQKANPNIKISMTATGNSDYVTYLRPRIAAGTAPDIIRTFPGVGNTVSVGPLGQIGAFVDLSNDPWVSQLTTGQKSLFSQGGKVFAVPVDSSALGPVYNQTVLTQLGVGVPQTWSDVMNLCQVAKSKGIFAYTIFQKGGSFLTSFALSAPLVYGPHPDFTDLQYQKKASFATSGWVDVFQRQLDMLHAGCWNDAPNGTDFTASTTMVATGKAAGIVFFTDVSYLVGLAPAGTSFVMGTQPVDDNPADSYLAVDDAYGFGINAKSSHIDAARKFIDFLGTAPAQNAFAQASGGGPAIPNSEYKGVSQTQQLLAQYISSHHTGPWPNEAWPNGSVAQALIDGSQNLFDGLATPTQVASNMDKAWAAAVSGS